MLHTHERTRRWLAARIVTSQAAAAAAAAAASPSASHLSVPRPPSPTVAASKSLPPASFAANFLDAANDAVNASMCRKQAAIEQAERIGAPMLWVEDDTGPVARQRRDVLLPFRNDDAHLAATLVAHVNAVRSCPLT
jgi:pyruvate/2-oxoglutarate dehydrogenase complex dihydrolipoamide acyltransferase (E2) component